MDVNTMMLCDTRDITFTTTCTQPPLSRVRHFLSSRVHAHVTTVAVTLDGEQEAVVIVTRRGALMENGNRALQPSPKAPGIAIIIHAYSQISSQAGLWSTDCETDKQRDGVGVSTGSARQLQDTITC